MEEIRREGIPLLSLLQVISSLVILQRGWNQSSDLSGKLLFSALEVSAMNPLALGSLTIRVFDSVLPQKRRKESLREDGGIV